MLKKTAATAIAAATLMWSGAALADACHYGPFNGAYIGASVGYAGLDADHTDVFSGDKLSSDDGSVIIGGHVGYNMQCGRVVVGIEGDLSYLDLGSSVTDPFTQTNFQTKVDMLGTLRGRLGVTIHETTLLYATAGVAWADRTHHVIDPNSPGGFFEQSDSDWATGFVVGGGIEFLRHDRWSLRAEVLWADLGDKERLYETTGCGDVPCEARVKWDDQIWTARVGLSLKLGHEAPPSYEPLK